MKKLILIAASCLFFSCDPEKQTYENIKLSPDLISGEWTQVFHTDSVVFVFETKTAKLLERTDYGTYELFKRVFDDKTVYLMYLTIDGNYTYTKYMLNDNKLYLPHFEYALTKTRE